MSAFPPASCCNVTWHWITLRAAALSGWKYAEPWSPSMAVSVPPGRSSRPSILSASSGWARCSRTKQTKTWSKEAGAKGSAKISACRNRTLVRQAASVARWAAAMDVAEMSIEVKRAPVLLRARVTVCAPTPQPASRTVLPLCTGYRRAADRPGFRPDRADGRSRLGGSHAHRMNSRYRSEGVDRWRLGVASLSRRGPAVRRRRPEREDRGRSRRRPDPSPPGRSPR